MAWLERLRARVALFCLVGAVGVCHAGSYEDFFDAIRLDQAEQVQVLLERGFDPNSVDGSGQAGLLVAIKGASYKVAQVLIADASTQVDVRNAADESPLMLAALKGQADLCEQLLARDADVNKPGWTPLHYAATGAQLPVVQLLLDHYAYIDAESPNGSTPLMLAAMYGSAEIVQLLLDAGADPGLKNALGLSAIDFALRVGKTDAAERIAKAVRDRRPKGEW